MKKVSIVYCPSFILTFSEIKAMVKIHKNWNEILNIFY